MFFATGGISGSPAFLIIVLVVSAISNTKSLAYSFLLTILAESTKHSVKEISSMEPSFLIV
jgi:hypothetical protein